MTGGDGRPSGAFETNTTAAIAITANSEYAMTHLRIALRGPMARFVSVSIS